MTNPLAGRLDPRTWFKHPQRPFEIEIGCGKGTFILEVGKANPEVNYLGIEWAREFYLYAADRVRRAQLTNVRMLRTDAAELLRWRVQDGLARVVHLYFSDPWPKRKHHKNRVVQHRFLAEVWRVLVPGGELRIVTDHDELWAWDQQHFDIWTNPEAWAQWLSGVSPTLDEHQGVPPVATLPPIPAGTAPYTSEAFVPPEWVGEGQLVGTNYERKFRKEDQLAHSIVLRKPLT